jgi:hypothetical protein
MALSPGTPNSAAPPQRGSLRLVPVTGARIPNRSAADRQGSIAGSAVALPKAPADEIDPGAIRTHASVAADDALRSIAENGSSSRRPALGRVTVPADAVPGTGEETLVLSHRRSKPYDPKPVRRPMLDILA